MKIARGQTGRNRNFLDMDLGLGIFVHILSSSKRMTYGDLTIRQKRIYQDKSGIYNMPRGAGKSIACIVSAFDYCKDNNNVRSIIISRSNNYLKTLMEMKDDTISINLIDGFSVVVFAETNSHLFIKALRGSYEDVISGMRNLLINERYDQVYIDDIDPETVVQALSRCVENRDNLGFYLDNIVKNKWAVVYTEIGRWV